jgi:hypothetical protein
MASYFVWMVASAIRKVLQSEEEIQELANAIGDDPIGDDAIGDGATGDGAIGDGAQPASCSFEEDSGNAAVTTRVSLYKGIS